MLLHRDGKVELAPLYDLVATRWFPHLAGDAAQRINGNGDIDTITVDDLITEATGWGIPSSVARRAVRQTIESVLRHRKAAVADCIANGSDPVVCDDVAQFITDRADRLRQT